MSEDVLDRELREQLGAYRTRIDAAMGELLRTWDAPAPLGDAMRYAIESGGKRIRPALAIAACEAVGGRADDVMPLGLALELVHTYSLVHDDLPAMDDDDERRGQPTLHVLYDEALAILAGDALLTEAFRVVADAPGLDAEQRIAAVRCLARSAGHVGMVGGQVRDIRADALSPDAVRRMHAEKTGALFVAACELGGIAARATAAQADALRSFAVHMGAAFQVSDDLLDCVELGDGIDEHEQAVNLAAHVGVPAAVAEVLDQVDQGAAALAALEGEVVFLETLLRWIGARARAAVA